MILSTCNTCHASGTDQEYYWARVWADQHMAFSPKCFNIDMNEQFLFKVIFNESV